MVDNIDEQYDGEEGEYHFSDDQVNYELESDTPKTEKSAVPSSSVKDILLTKWTQHRKILIGVAVFLVLTGVVYKLVMPSSTTPNTDIVAENSSSGAASSQPNSGGQVPSTSATVASGGLQMAQSSQSVQSSQQAQSSQSAQPLQQSQSAQALQQIQSSQQGQPSQLVQSSQSAQSQQTSPEQMTQTQQLGTNPNPPQAGASNMIPPAAVAQATGSNIPTSNPVGQTSSGATGSPTGMAQASESNPLSFLGVLQGQVPPGNSGVQTTSANTTQSVPSGMVSPSGVVQSNGFNANPSQNYPSIPPNNPMQQAQSMTASAAQQIPMDAQSKNIIDRLAALEQQNAAMMNLLQTEYAQKMSDYETQSTSSRGKMEELTKRINRMESLIVQLSQVVQNGRQGSMTGTLPTANMVMLGSAPSEAVKVTEPKINYSVQAIIPGRAWLKSESGDTITVAEGDILRNYGRVTKIDPYDGIVNIDTGNKVITLSYGVSAD